MGLFNKSFETLLDIITGKDNKANYVYAMAEAHAIDIIAGMISTREIQVYAKNQKNKKIEKVRNNIYWLLNIKPNPNENGTQFFYKFMTKLLTDKTALIIINNLSYNKNFMYVADDYKCNDSVLYGKVFYDIRVSDDNGNSLKIEKTYTQDNAIYFSIKNLGLEGASETYKTQTKKFLNAAQKNFIQNNLPKWRLTPPGRNVKLFDAKTKEEIDYSKYKEQVTQGLMSDDESIILLSESTGLENLNEKMTKGFSDLDLSSKKISDEVAQKWKIPLDIFYMKQTEKSNAINDFVTLCLDRYFRLIEDGLNSVLVGMESFTNGEYIKFNTMKINHKDIIDSANGIDKLIGDGFSRNEVNDVMDLPQIDEDWADEHNLTKNYGKISKKGGDK